MALKISLSEFSRTKLAENISQSWFVELLDVLRNTGAFSEGNYSKERPMTEMEHQALNGRYRQGFVGCVEHIATIAQPAKEKPTPSPEPFGTLTKPTPDPKKLPTNQPPEK